MVEFVCGNGYQVNWVAWSTIGTFAVVLASFLVPLVQRCWRTKEARMQGALLLYPLLEEMGSNALLWALTFSKNKDAKHIVQLDEKLSAWPALDRFGDITTLCPNLMVFDAKTSKALAFCVGWGQILSGMIDASWEEVGGTVVGLHPKLFFDQNVEMARQLARNCRYARDAIFLLVNGCERPSPQEEIEFARAAEI